ncbi:restriction endonuclease [Haliscomenobacter sp.]|uniref:restriction endonuclease n=1 Tax=Haliscomenobacter sp. TaxID=2717303 RepID=UPI003BAAD6F2
MAKQAGKSIQTAAKVIFAAFLILKENGGEMRSRDIQALIPSKVNLTEWETERYEKTGYTRWISMLHFYSVDCIKAGFMQKQKGLWILTPEGEEAMKLGPEEMMRTASKAYRVWKTSSTDAKEEKEVDSPEVVDSPQQQVALLDQYEEMAREGIQNYINAKNPYEFQDLVATLLRAMGYFISFNAKRGKDGGIDVVAYSDPLGTREPRMKVQVKHRPNDAVSVDVVKQLVANLNKPGDVGLFVTSGRFTSESERYARESHRHVELINLERFVSLWQEFYSKMTDEEKNMLPLQPIYFLGVNG